MTTQNYYYHLKTDTNESWSWATAFTPEECIKIIELCKTFEEETPVIEDSTTAQVIKTAVRRGKIAWIPVNQTTQWIFDRCALLTHYNNDKYFNFDLNFIQTLQFTTYTDDNDFYDKHVDMLFHSNGTRKLSFTIQLSETDSYEGGDVLLHTNAVPIKLNREQGIGTFFPSYVLHEVKPVTKGIRYSLVGWVVGPKFK
jgi:PKHD-type hydroxylase